MIKDCQSKVDECLPCNESPVENLSAEAPDSPTFFSLVVLENDPPIGETWEALGCLGLEFSTISQADADAKALAQSELCQNTVNLPPPPAPPTEKPPWVWPDWPVASCESGTDPLAPLAPKVVFGAETFWMLPYSTTPSPFLYDEVSDPLAYSMENPGGETVSVQPTPLYCCYRGGVFYNTFYYYPSYQVYLLKRPNQPWEFFYRVIPNGSRTLYERALCTDSVGPYPGGTCTEVTCLTVPTMSGKFLGYSYTNTYCRETSFQCPDLTDWLYRLRVAMPWIDVECAAAGEISEEQRIACVQTTAQSHLWQVATGGTQACLYTDCQATQDADHTVAVPTRVGEWDSSGTPVTLPYIKWKHAMREGNDSSTPAGFYYGISSARVDGCGNLRAELIDGGNVTVTHEVPPP